MLTDVFRTEPHPLQVHVEGVVPVLLVHLQQTPDGSDAGVVGQDVYLAELVERRLDGVLDVLLGGDVHPDADGLRAAVARQLDGLVEFRLVTEFVLRFGGRLADVSRDHVGPVPRVRERVRTSLSSRCSGDENHRVGEVVFDHVVLHWNLDGRT